MVFKSRIAQLLEGFPWTWESVRKRGTEGCMSRAKGTTESQRQNMVRAGVVGEWPEKPGFQTISKPSRQQRDGAGYAGL